MRNIHAAIKRFATVNGFFVEISNPAKKDWEIPIYNTGSIFGISQIYGSKIIKKRQ